jgi:DNA-binding GntR family transcriptional regulator
VSDWSIDVLQRVSTTEQATQALRDAIVGGRIPQGESLRETQVASMLGTGRSAVREAIRQLVQEGLVEHELHRGAWVRLLGSEDVEDIYSAREAIEPFAAGLFLQRPREESETEPLESTIKALEKAATGRNKPPGEVIELDIRFHEQLVALGGSWRLSRAHSTVAAEARMVLHHHPELPLLEYAQEHQTLLEAVLERDRRLPDLLCDHLKNSAVTVTNWLREISDGNGPHE